MGPYAFSRGIWGLSSVDQVFISRFLVELNFLGPLN
jgi:hypothetical protein